MSGARRALGVLTVVAAVLAGVALIPAGFLLYADLHGLNVWDVVRTRLTVGVLAGVTVGLFLAGRGLLRRR